MVITLSNITHMRTRQLSHKYTAYRADTQTAHTRPHQSTRSVPRPLFRIVLSIVCFALYTWLILSISRSAYAIDFSAMSLFPWCTACADLSLF